MRTVIGIIALAWSLCGVLALLVLIRAIPAASALADVVLLWPAILLWSLGITKILTDAAHGPPFLTVMGIFVLYWIPSVLVAGYLVATRRRTT
jgi:hypothetical protein